MPRYLGAIFTIVLMMTLTSAQGQTSSNFVTDSAVEATDDTGRRDAGLSPAIAKASFVALGRPVPRKFSVQDLITVIVRETVTTNSYATLETEKKMSQDGTISAMPKLTLSDLLNAQVRQSDLTGRQPRVGIEFDRDWEGGGTQSQRHNFTARMTARIIDVKPNGTLVLEAKKTIQTDGEAFSLVMTGTCRKQDVTADNSVLSTQLYDLRVVKDGTGEIRKANKKGVLTKLFEAILNF